MPKGVKPTPKQIAFVKKYLETGNGTKAALKAYDTKDPTVANAIAVENLQKPSVIALLQSYAGKAALRLEELSDQNENLPVALGATKDILDRAGIKPKEQAVDSITITWHYGSGDTVHTEGLGD